MIVFVVVFESFSYDAFAEPSAAFSSLDAALQYVAGLDQGRRKHGLWNVFEMTVDDPGANVTQYAAD